MDESYLFRPPRRMGLVVHGGMLLCCLAGGGFGLWQAARAEVGLSFMTHLLLALGFLGPLPLLGYRAYALWRASYILERDGLRLRWGLRAEEIPMNAVTGIYLDEELDFRLPAPLPALPGAVLGTIKLGELPPIEFMAARPQHLVLVATPQRIFALSPLEREAFVQTFQRLMELGTLTPLAAQSLRPTFLLSRLWADGVARALLLAGLAFNLGLAVWVSAAIPAQAFVSLRLSPAGQALEQAPSVRLLLLPVINAAFFVVDLLAGLFFYRDNDLRPLAYLLWASNVITNGLFAAAVYFILRAT